MDFLEGCVQSTVPPTVFLGQLIVDCTINPGCVVYILAPAQHFTCLQLTSLLQDSRSVGVGIRHTKSSAGAADQRTYSVQSQCCACRARSCPFRPRRFSPQRLTAVDDCRDRPVRVARFATGNVSRPVHDNLDAATVSGGPPRQVGRHLVSVSGLLQTVISPADTCD